MNKHAPIQYHDYLGLDKLLDAQSLRSEQVGTPAHEEMLFIIVHQTYELWFKQILWELNSVMKLFSQEGIEDSLVAKAVTRLERMVSIQKFINGQIDILETMTALDFLDFRDALYPASGFQSYQWRLIETKLGLRASDRLAYTQGPFYKQLKADQQVEIQKVLDEPSLFDLIEKWLERTPFLKTEGFNFWQEYKKQVHVMFAKDRETITSNPRLSDEDRKRNFAMVEGSLKTFDAFFDPVLYEGLRKDGHFRLSFHAIHAALLVQVYGNEPLMQMPFRVIQALIDIDEHMTQWRYRHSLMAHRMLGRKIGTGGSSGHDYLKNATDQHKIFGDFFNLTTFFIPRSMVPPLPKEMKAQLNFQFSSK